ncbi:MAG TPA: tetratricopeptide repeat protein [Vicinamibacterales bacterium]|jgi:Tfp pilus assembly protein PilF|nr:tetratricopeptide repeat protein [Vicinamibacterales bacterium]
MLLSLFLLLLAQNVPQPAANGPADLSAAIQLAQQGRNAEALAALQKIAAADPNDHLTRLWIANVHARMAHPELAENVYRSITFEDPRNVDAWVGLGTVLLQQDRISEGLNALNRAEEIAPENPSVWGALASGYELAGYTSRSISYYERLASTSPTTINRLNLENARRQYQHRFESQTFGEDYNGSTPTTRGEDLAVNYRLSDGVRAIGRWQVERKFSRNENRGGGGVEWRWTPWGTLTGQVLVNDNNRVLPQRDYLARVDYGYHRATYTAALRYFDFFGANTTMFSPGVTIALTPRWTFGAKYAFTTSDTASRSSVEGNTVDLRAAHEILPRLWLRGGYIRGIENFDQFSIDHIGDFRANTANAGVQLLFPSLTSIVVNYDYQKRENNVKMQRLNIGLVQAF